MLLKTEPFRTKRYFFDKQTGQLSNTLFDIKRKKEIDLDALKFFLSIGYVPGNSTIFKDIDCLPGGCEIAIDKNSWKSIGQKYTDNYFNPDPYLELNKKELIKTGGEIFLNIIDKLYQKKLTNIVPISGGIDSRAILAGLLEVTEAKNITSFTFGTPNTFDFEIGKKVSKNLGVKHCEFDLTKIKLDIDDLMKTAICTDSNTDLFQSTYLLKIYKNFPPESKYWIGYLGDPIAGSHKSNKNVTSIAQAKDSFFKQESRLYFNDADNINSINSNLLIYNKYLKRLDIIENIDFMNRQERYVTNQLFFNNVEYINPFCEIEWLNYFFSIPNKYREESLKYYTELWESNFPNPFKIETKRYYNKNFYKLLNKLNKKIKQDYNSKYANYIDYSNSIKNDLNFRNLLHKLLEDLMSNNVIKNLNLKQLVKAVDEDLYNNTSKATLLSSLYIILKANYHE